MECDPDRPPAPGPRRRLVLSVGTSLLSWGFAVLLSIIIRRHEAGRSRAIPTGEDWFLQMQEPSPASVRHGRTLYLQNCAHCHAADAEGDEGPDLHALEVSNRYVANTIIRGIKGEMPSFRKKLGANEIQSLTGYLRSLQ